jgi:hypothetical protein
MIDLKILTIKDVLQVTEVRIVPNFFPVTVEITGPDFLGTTQVHVNDLPVTEFIVQSKTKILAQVPDSQVSSKITRIKVLSDKLTVNRSSLLGFEIGKTFNGISGLQKLVQLFCKVLLQSAGSDRFVPTAGGGLLDLVGSNVSKRSAQSLSVAVSNAVNQTRDHILSIQGRARRPIPLDEKLKSADTQATSFDPATTTLSAVITVLSAAGKEATASLAI